MPSKKYSVQNFRGNYTFTELQLSALSAVSGNKERQMWLTCYSCMQQSRKRDREMFIRTSVKKDCSYSGGQTKTWRTMIRLTGDDLC